jgi:DNA topoisomerase-3
MLILTEKPSVALAFASALSVPRKTGCWENADYCVVNALGHLLEDYAPEDYDPSLKKWSLDGLPIIPEKVKYKTVEKTKEQLAIVKKCFDAHRSEPFLLATDAEREGELIGAEILDYVGFTNFAAAKRFWVSEALTKEVILAGMQNAKPLADYASYKEQGYARQEADWLIGMNLTRLVSLKCGKTLTAGRVQTAVLGAVYDRDDAIARFTKEKYFEVSASLSAEAPFTVKLLNPLNADFPFRFFDGDQALANIANRKNEMKSGTVTALKKERKTNHPPQLFNLTELQKQAHKKFSYSPEQTLNIAQALYETHKCMSYPRTPSRVMGDENVDLVKGVFENLREHMPELAAGADIALVTGGNKRVFNTADLVDHHALIPLAPIPDEASPEEKNVFSLVCKRFFTVFKPDYIYDSVSVSVDISGFSFQGNGIEVAQAGWKTEREDDEETPEHFEGVKENGVYPVTSISADEKFTDPPKRHTFATLLALMENPRDDEGRRLAGLGTPATRGSILKKLVDRNYLVSKGKTITVSEDGKFLIEQIRKNGSLGAFFSIPETTRWEEQLHSDTVSFLNGIKDFIRQVVANTSMDKYQAEKTSLGKCPLCGGEVYEGRKNYYCGKYKEGCKFVIWKEIAGAAVSPDDAKLLLSGKQTKPKKCKNKDGKPFEAAFGLRGPEVKFIFKQDK